VNLATVGLLYLVLRRRYTARARGFLAGQVAAGTLSSSQAADLVSRFCRRRSVRRATSGTEREAVRADQQRILAELDIAAA